MNPIKGLPDDPRIPDALNDYSLLVDRLMRRISLPESWLTLLVAKSRGGNSRLRLPHCKTVSWSLHRKPRVKRRCPEE